MCREDGADLERGGHTSFDVLRGIRRMIPQFLARDVAHQKHALHLERTERFDHLRHVPAGRSDALQDDAGIAEVDEGVSLVLDGSAEQAVVENLRHDPRDRPERVEFSALRQSQRRDGRAREIAEPLTERIQSCR